MTDRMDPRASRVPRGDLDPELVARARRVIKARERRDRWARFDHDANEARQEAHDVWNGGNRG